jgi:hypothetical protein
LSGGALLFREAQAGLDAVKAKLCFNLHAFQPQVVLTHANKQASMVGNSFLDESYMGSPQKTGNIAL